MISIVIPTYNRASRIINRLHELDCLSNPLLHEILVIDNHSDDESWAELTTYCDKRPNPNIILTRNKYNIGMSANLARSLELANGEWVVILGDDDPILSSFWNHLEAALKSEKIDSIGCFIFSSQTNNKAYFSSNSIFLNKTDSFPFFATLGSFMIHREKIESSMRNIYTYGMISFHPQVCCLLHPTSSRNAFQTIPSNLISFRGDSEHSRPAWSKPKLFMGNFALLFQDNNLSCDAFKNYSNLIKINSCGPFTLLEYLLDDTFNYPFAQVRYIHKLTYHSCVFQIDYFSYLNLMWLISLFIISLPSKYALIILKSIKNRNNQYSQSEQRM